MLGNSESWRGFWRMTRGQVCPWAILSSRQLSVPAPVVVAAKSTPTPPIQPPLRPIQPHSDQSESSSKPSGALRPPLLRWRQLQLHFDPLPKPQQPAQAVASEDAKAAKEEDAGEATQQEDQHEKKEDKDEEKDFNHEEKEDTHEEKTDSNHQESQDGSASASGPQDQEPIARQKSSSELGLNCSGESWWCRWERICCCRAHPCARDCTGSGSTTGTVFACGNVPMANERSSNTNAQPNVYLRIASSEDATTMQLLQVFGSSSRSIVILWRFCASSQILVAIWYRPNLAFLTEGSILHMLANTESCRSFWGTFSHYMRLLKL